MGMEFIVALGSAMIVWAPFLSQKGLSKVPVNVTCVPFMYNTVLDNNWWQSGISTVNQ